MRLSVTLDLSPLAHAMRQLDDNLDRAMSESLSEAANMVAAEARTKHGYTDRTGSLTRSIHSSVFGNFTDRTLQAEVIADTPYARFVEEGTRPHEIRARNGRALRFRGRNGRYVFRQRVHHPGTKPVRFLKGALDRLFPVVGDGMADGLRRGFELSGFEVA